jgi:anti-anti-sigma factor
MVPLSRREGAAMSQSAQVTVRRIAGVDVVQPHGSVCFGEHEPLLEALLFLAESDDPRIVVDLSDVSLCDSSALNVLLQAHRRASSHGGWLRLAGAQPLVRRVLHMTNLNRLLPIYDTVEQALKPTDGERQG